MICNSVDVVAMNFQPQLIVTFLKANVAQKDRKVIELDIVSDAV